VKLTSWLVGWFVGWFVGWWCWVHAAANMTADEAFAHITAELSRRYPGHISSHTQTIFINAGAQPHLPRHAVERQRPASLVLCSRTNTAPCACDTSVYARRWVHGLVSAHPRLALRVHPLLRQPARHHGSLWAVLGCVHASYTNEWPASELTIALLARRHL
jgi:hypothetical protein